MEVFKLDLRLEMKDPKSRKRLGEFSPFCEDRDANDPKKDGHKSVPAMESIWESCWIKTASVPMPQRCRRLPMNSWRQGRGH